MPVSLPVLNTGARETYVWYNRFHRSCHHWLYCGQHFSTNQSSWSSSNQQLKAANTPAQQHVAIERAIESLCLNLSVIMMEKIAGIIWKKKGKGKEKKASHRLRMFSFSANCTCSSLDQIPSLDYQRLRCYPWNRAYCVWLSFSRGWISLSVDLLWRNMGCPVKSLLANHACCLQTSPDHSYGISEQVFPTGLKTVWTLQCALHITLSYGQDSPQGSTDNCNLQKKIQ